MKPDSSGLAVAAPAAADGRFWDAVDKTGFINVEAGKHRAADMGGAYPEILELFCGKLPRECGLLENCLSGSDWPGFAIAVHGMKSSLSTICALGLSEAARELEDAAKSGNSRFCEDASPKFLKSLKLLRARLTDMFNIEHSAENQNRPKGDRVYLCENAKTVLNAAKAYDRDTGLEALKRLLEYDYGAETGGVLKSAQTALKNFDFEEAVKQLRAMLRI